MNVIVLSFIFDMKIVSEKISINSKRPYLLSAFSGNEVSLDYPFHYHEQSYELTLTLGLTGTRLTGDRIARFGEEDLILAGPHLPHGWYAPREELPDGRVVVWQFGPGFPGVPPEDRDDLRAVTELLKKSANGIEFTGTARRQAGNMLLAALKLEGADRFLQLLQLLTYLASADEMQMLTAGRYLYPKTNIESQRFEKAHTYIREYYTQKISVKDVADKVGMSPSAFSHFFKKYTRMHFTDFVNELRLAEAARLLQQTDETISGIAFIAGFQNLSLFNRMFKRKYGLSPRKYRQNQQL